MQLRKLNPINFPTTSLHNRDTLRNDNSNVQLSAAPHCGIPPIYSATPHSGIPPIYSATPHSGIPPIYSATPHCGIPPMNPSFSSTNEIFAQV